MAVAHFTVYSRSYCHLCEEMVQALDRFRSQYQFSVEVIDVDSDAALVQQYDELVPVLLGRIGAQAPRQLCHYFLDEEKLALFLLSCGQ